MLEIANLSHTYANGTVALDDVSLSLPRGMFGLLGPNGAGKSTLMRTVATLQAPTAGTITFGDIDVLAQPERLRRTLGYLPQDFGVYPRVSAFAMLDQMAVLKGITGKADRKSVVETLLAQTNLWSVRDKAIAGFSGGMRQRLGIAQALIGNPELIIVDEPTAGLDPEERNRFLNLLAAIGDNVVVILSTHIVDDVRAATANVRQPRGSARSTPSYETSDEAEKFSADYERKYLKYEKLPRPVVTKVVLDAQLFPSERRLVVNGRYELRNDTNAPIREVHLRSSDRDVEWLKLDLAGARLVSNDADFGYRIYRFDAPLAPGAGTTLAFTSRIWRRGFRAGSPNTDVIENGTFANNGQFTPAIGMGRQGLLSDRTQRRRQGLPAELRMAKLEDMSATARNYAGEDWVMSDITLTTDAGQTPIAPGNRVSDVTQGGRRTARFVSPAPILNFFSVQSADYQVAKRNHDGVELSVLYQRGHE